jgi:hypothetical protein
MDDQIIAIFPKYMPGRDRSVKNYRISDNGREEISERNSGRPSYGPSKTHVSICWHGSRRRLMTFLKHGRMRPPPWIKGAQRAAMRDSHPIDASREQETDLRLKY